MAMTRQTAYQQIREALRSKGYRRIAVHCSEKPTEWRRCEYYHNGERRAVLETVYNCEGGTEESCQLYLAATIRQTIAATIAAIP